MLDIGLSDVLIYFILKAELMIVPVKMFALKPAAFAALHSTVSTKCQNQPLSGFRSFYFRRPPIRGDDRRGTDLKL
jgi:hypothetical protein